MKHGGSICHVFVLFEDVLSPSSTYLLFFESDEGYIYMFMKFKPAQRKIAMGLLSYMPEEKSIKLLLETVQKYETESS